MKIIDALRKIKIIRYAQGSHPVVHTSALELNTLIRGNLVEGSKMTDRILEADTLTITLGSPPVLQKVETFSREAGDRDFTFLQIDDSGSGAIICSKPCFLFAFVRMLLEVMVDRDIESVREGRMFSPAFRWHRICYDFFLTQEGRIQKNLDREAYIREMARLAFTHGEVNGLAFPSGLETGPEGEAYPMFYTYCPALDQFVHSSLNRGIYPESYLTANLKNLKENARLMVKYGMTPGLLCFEPRSVPEEFFSRYPMLRGARVDHPFRSFKPRYNMTIAHPRVREHYEEMVKEIMGEVPELGFLSVWTNDSGAGFEHTRSLYAGRNGGAYLIREWKDDEEIARVAGENALRFLRTLRDAARTINPEFRVITRMESFYGEHDTIWNGLGDSLDIETASLLAKGWDIPCAHPRYPEKKSINAGTVYQSGMDSREREKIELLHEKGSRAHYYFAAGPHTLFEPLLGIPYPNLTYGKLKRMYAEGVEYIAHNGGTFPPSLVPFNINHEISRRFQLNPAMTIEHEIAQIARTWAGEEAHLSLLDAWKSVEDAILAFPIISPLYSTFGFTWYRLWVRPLVPNIEALLPEERDYYEAFMCTTPHNPNNVDLSRDVLFELTTAEQSVKDVKLMDLNLWAPIDRAISILRNEWKRGAVSHNYKGDTGENDEQDADKEERISTQRVIYDQLIRIRALRCWFMTQRNVAAWIAGVCGYMNATHPAAKSECRTLVSDMIAKEIENSAELQQLLKSGIDFMALTDQAETPLIHGVNIDLLLDRRKAIMTRHRDDEPYIDPEYMEKRAVASEPMHTQQYRSG
jgi:hypothetical protein